MKRGVRCTDYRETLAARAEELANHGADIPQKLQRLGVPADCVEALGRPVGTKALDGAKRFIVAPRPLIRTLLLIGERGVGKSVAAAWVLREWAKQHDWNSQPSGGPQHPPAMWVHASEMTSETDFGRVNPEWLEDLKRCQVLVVDDLGKDATAAGLTALRDVLTFRHERRKATVVTSNARGVVELEQRYGESWYSRLKVAALAPDLSGERSLRRRMA